MHLRTHLSSLRNVHMTMAGSGLFAGVGIVLYSSLFFGTAAFRPMHLLGCLAAGAASGSFCFYLAKLLLRLELERLQVPLVLYSSFPPDASHNQDLDELEALAAARDQLSAQLSSLTDQVALLTGRIAALHENAARKQQEIALASRTQTAKEGEALATLEEMEREFGFLVVRIDKGNARAAQKNAISAEMSATTDVIAENIREHSASMLETSASIEEMLMSVKQTASTIQQLATSTEQTVQSIARIGTSIGNVRDSAQRAADSSEGVRQQAKGGLLYMATTLKAMREIEKANDDSFDSINRLSIHSARVGEFLSVIQDVVEQTNLLSLNASIIAAQAGERGKAFAVVAEEVRSLAHRTSLSAKEIGELVKNIQRETAAVQRTVTQGKARVKDGVKISQQTNEALVKIEYGAAEASELVKRIAAATIEQAAQGKVIEEEAGKNLQRVKSATEATARQEAGIAHIVAAMEQMRFLSLKINECTEEQARGNRILLENLEEENQRVKQLRDFSLQQIGNSERLLEFVKESGRVREESVLQAAQIVEEFDKTAAPAEILDEEEIPSDDFDVLPLPPGPA